MKIIIEKLLDDSWATDDEFRVLTDSEIVELLQEDLSELIDGATWRIERYE
jgi:hypothetical protein